MNEILNRIKQFYTYRNMTSRAFAISIDFSYSTLNNYILGKRTIMDGELLSKTLSTYEELSAEWLLRGEGDMLKLPGCEDSINNRRVAKLIDTVSSQQGTIELQAERIRRLESMLNK